MPSRLLNVRLDDDRRRRLEEFCSREGVAKSEAMRRALDSFLTSRVPLLGSTVSSHNGSAEMGGSGRTVDLAVWLSGKTRMPRSLMKQRIAQGRVKVDGVVCRDLRVPVPSAGSVEVEGERY